MYNNWSIGNKLYWFVIAAITKVPEIQWLEMQHINSVSSIGQKSGMGLSGLKQAVGSNAFFLKAIGETLFHLHL